MWEALADAVVHGLLGLEAGTRWGSSVHFFVHEVALAVFLGSFGWEVTLLYAASGILLGTVLGAVLGRLELDHLLERWAREAVGRSRGRGLGVHPGWEDGSRSDLLRRVSREAMEITVGVAPYVVAGVAVVAAVPMYAGASGVIPVIESLVAKGVPLGTALAFMMGVVGLSLPEVLMLKKVMRPRLLATFFGNVAASIVLVGYGFNVLF